MGYFLEIADRFGVVDELNESAIWAIGDDRIWFDPYFDVFFEEDLVDECDELHGHILLSKIVTWFDQVALDSMTGNLAENGFLD